jgi:CDP-diacylglycerol pyrophosphatase
MRRVLFAAVMTVVAAARADAADPDALWKIVHDKCVPNEEQHADPAPCTLVDVAGGITGGYVVLKDINGATQYLLLPTARLSGIEDPLLLDPSTPNYFAVAWQERTYTERAAGHALPRDGLSLAVNSPLSRSQNQLHIHIDCLRVDVRDALRRQAAAIGDSWAPLATTLAGHHYWALRVDGEDLGAADPFKLLAAKPAAMSEQTLVVAGAEFADGRRGFVLLNDQVDVANGDRASGEELQDHACALARP